MLRILLVVLSLFCNQAKAQVNVVDLDRLVQAICQVETGGEADPSNAVGDSGKAIGPYQIHRAYWVDATQYDKTIGGTYADCKDKAYATKVVMAYLRRYSPKNATVEDLARIHNGGPRGHLKVATVKYWAKVSAVLRKEEDPCRQ